MGHAMQKVVEDVLEQHWGLPLAGVAMFGSCLSAIPCLGTGHESSILQIAGILCEAFIAVVVEHLAVRNLAPVSDGIATFSRNPAASSNRKAGHDLGPQADLLIPFFMLRQSMAWRV